MRLSEYYEAYLQYRQQKGAAPKTIEEHRRMLYGALSHSIQDKELSELTIADSAAVEEAGRIHGEHGALRACVVLRRLLCYIKERGEPLPFDWRDIKLPRVRLKPVEYLTDEEIQKIRESLNVSNIAYLRTRALIEVLLDSGMRISEAIALNKTDIDWEKKETRVVNAKTKDIELVYFTDRSLNWLRRYLDARKDTEEALFVSGRGRLLPVTSRNFIRVHLGSIGINKHIHHHLFRKTYTTRLIEHGATIVEVKYLARHKSERTTLKHYLAVNKDKAKETHQRIMGSLT